MTVVFGPLERSGGPFCLSVGRSRFWRSKSAQMKADCHIPAKMEGRLGVILRPRPLRA